MFFRHGAGPSSDSHVIPAPVIRRNRCRLNRGVGIHPVAILDRVALRCRSAYVPQASGLPASLTQRRSGYQRPERFHVAAQPDRFGAFVPCKRFDATAAGDARGALPELRPVAKAYRHSQEPRREPRALSDSTVNDTESFNNCCFLRSSLITIGLLFKGFASMVRPDCQSNETRIS